MTTTKQLLDEALTRARARKAEAHLKANQNAAREFSIAIHALEDAQMRYTRGVAHMQDLFASHDLEQLPPVG